MITYLCLGCAEELPLPNQLCPACTKLRALREEAERQAGQDPRVQAIRQHPRLNESSCTTISECFTDVELLDHLVSGARPSQQLTPDQAVLWALDYEGLQVEAALNTRWGEDNDPQLEAYRDWDAANRSQSHPDQQV